MRFSCASAPRFASLHASCSLEGRQPVTFGRWSGMRRLRAWASSAWALGWPWGQPSGPTMGFCLQWLDWRLVSGSRKLPCSGRRRADPPRPRKHGPEAETTPRRSAGRRGVSSPGDAGVLRTEPLLTTVRRPALRPPSFAKRGTAQTAGSESAARECRRLSDIRIRMTRNVRDATCAKAFSGEVGTGSP